MKPALFLDLDNTVIKTKSGQTFAKDIDDWQFNGDILDALQLFVSRGYAIIIVTNQGGVKAGFLTHSMLKRKLNHIGTAIMEVLETNSRPYTFCIIASTEDNYNRKPYPGMAFEAACLHNINLRESIMVGDASGLEKSFADTDLQFARNAGISTYIDIEDFLSPSDWGNIYLDYTNLLEPHNI